MFRAILEAAWQDNKDSAHDIGHILRVVANAKKIMHEEGGQDAVILPSAWLHDIVNLPKIVQTDRRHPLTPQMRPSKN